MVDSPARLRFSIVLQTSVDVCATGRVDWKPCYKAGHVYQSRLLNTTASRRSVHAWSAFDKAAGRVPQLEAIEQNERASFLHLQQ